jgi:hypothetical protein
MVENRSKVISIIETLEELTHLHHSAPSTLSLTPFYSPDIKKWYHPLDFLSLLHSLPFFHHFSLHTLTSIFSTDTSLKLTMKTYVQGEVVMLSIQEIGVVVGGRVGMWSHAGVVGEPALVGVFGVGKILGSELGSGVERRKETWMVARWRLSIVVMSVEEFHRLWRWYYTDERRLQRSFLRGLYVFNWLSEITFFEVWNLTQKWSYKANCLIWPQNKKSMFNFAFSEFNDDQVSSLQAEATQELAHGGKLIQSNFQRMLTQFSHANQKRLSATLNLISKMDTMARQQSYFNEEEPSEEDSEDAKHPINNVNFNSDIEGVYILNQGTCEVINRLNKLHVWTIMNGSSFGHGQLVKSLEYADFGDIYSKTDVEVFFIPNEVMRQIPKDEFLKIVEFFQDRYSNLEYTLCQKYGIEYSKIKEIE